MTNIQDPAEALLSGQDAPAAIGLKDIVIIVDDEEVSPRLQEHSELVKTTH